MNQKSWTTFLLLCSFRNLWRSPRRTIISLGAIAAACSSLIIFQSFVEGVRDTFRENVITSEYGHYQIYHREFRETAAIDPYRYLIDDKTKLREQIEARVGSLAFLSRQQSFFGLLGNGDKSTGGRGIGIDAAEEKKFLTLTQVYQGKHLAGSLPESVFLGYEFAEKIGVAVGDNVTLLVNTAQGSLNALDLEVVGTFKSGVTELDQNVFYTHYETANKILNVQGAQKVLIGFNSDDEKQYQGKLNNLLMRSFPTLEIVHWEDLAKYFENTMGWLDSIFFIFRIIIILIATLSIINVFTITLLEREGEFGTLRAIGTKPKEIVAMVVAEGFMQSVLGALIGAVLGIFFVSIVLSGGVSMPPPLLMSVPFQVSFSVPWMGVIITTLLCVLVAGGAGILPAFKTARVNIVQALGRNV